VKFVKHFKGDGSYRSLETSGTEIRLQTEQPELDSRKGQCILNNEAQTASYTNGTEGSLPESKADEM
jgi:hypothetical protein